MREIAWLLLCAILQGVDVLQKGTFRDVFPDFPKFSYAQGGRDWPYLCQNVPHQSPIDITSSLPNPAQYQIVTAVNSTFTPLTVRSWSLPWDSVTVANVNGLIIYFTYDGNVASQLVDGFVYNHMLAEIHFVAPAEHLIDGVRYPLELHLAYAMQQPEGDVITGLNLSIFFKEGKAHPLLDLIMNEEAIDVTSVFPDSHVVDDYYYYAGSIDVPFPDCSTPLVYLIPSYILEVSSTQLEYINNMYQNNFTFANGMGNNRVVQPLGDRIIYHFISPPQDLSQSFLN